MKLFVSAAAALFAAFSALIPLQARIDAWRAASTPADEILYIPKGQYLKTAVLGYDSVVADLLWLRGISLFGDKYRRDPDTTWFAFLQRLVEVASDLDPLDFRIYLYGGIMLQLQPSYKEAANEIFLKGTENTDHFFLPLAVAIHAIDEHSDYDTAVKYLQIAAERPGAPFYLPRLISTLLDKGRQREAAIAFLQEQLKFLPEGSLEADSVLEKIRDLQYDLHRDLISEARTRFQLTFGRDPEPLSELLGAVVKATALPPDPYGGQWVIDKESGAVISTRFPARRRPKKRAQEGDGHGGEAPVGVEIAPAGGALEP